MIPINSLVKIKQARNTLEIFVGVVSLKTYLNLSVLSIALTGAFTATIASAQQDQTPQLGSVVVTAAGFEQKIVDAPASISVITEEDLRSRPYTSLVDAVRDLEGVDVGETTDKTGQRTISIRGMGSEYTLILVNGKRQNNHGNIYPNNFGGNQFNHIPPLDAIERIEVIRGPASTLYGADALGGVINIITKRITDKWGGSATVSRTFQQKKEFGDDTTYDFFVQGPIIQDLLGLSVRGSLYKRDASSPEFAPVTDPSGALHQRGLGFGGGGRTVDNTNKSLGLSLAFTPTKNQTITLDWDTSRQKYDNSESQVGTLDGIDSIWRASRGTVQPRVGYAADQKFNRDQWGVTHEGDWSFGHSMVSLSHVRTTNDGRSLPFRPDERLTLQEIYEGTGPYAGLTTAERKQIAEAEFLPRPKRSLESSQYTLDAKLDMPIENLAGDHIVVVGGQWIHGNLKDGVFGMESNLDTKKQPQRMYSVFLEDSWSPIQPLTITGGVRYDHHKTFKGHVSPRIYGVYEINPQWTVKGGVSTGYKTPNTTDLYDGITGFGGQGTSPFVGNPDLKPETSVNSEIALYWEHPERHGFNITFFNNQFKDKIARGETTQSCADTGGVRPCVNLGEYGNLGYNTYAQNINMDRARIRGLEMGARYQLLPTIGLKANYTYTNSKVTKGANEGKPLTGNAKHMANGTVEWDFLPQARTFLTAEYRSKRYRGAVNQEYYKAYTVFHLGGHYNISKNFTLNARINNLFNKDFRSYNTVFTDEGNGTYSPTYLDDYNNKDKARNFWISLTGRF